MQLSPTPDPPRIEDAGAADGWHPSSALTIATMLSDHRNVAAVHYPGLPTFAHAAIVDRQMSAGGGLVSFELKGGLNAGRVFMNALRLAHLG